MIPNVRPFRHLRHSGIGLLAFVVVFVQMAHPWMHPHEVIGSEAGDQRTCPMSHVVGDLQLDLSPLVPVVNILDVFPDPQPWLGHPAFLHSLAPRPPPVVPA
jgi:hypothetical protein